MKRTTAQSNNAAQDLPSFKNLEGLPAAALPADQWQQYAEAASRFAAEWAHEMDEKGNAHSFWDEFLQIFNIRRRQLAPLGFARHEARAKRSDNRRGFIDLFWPGMIETHGRASLRKHKADDFDEVLRQAMDYIGEPQRGKLEAKDRPQKLILYIFKTFRLYVVETHGRASLHFAEQLLKEEEKSSIEAALRGKLRFLDPACGCGNFLVVTYRELRLLNLEVVRVVRRRIGQLVATISKTLTDLYDPNKMPAELLALHKQLDAAVDACYGLKKGFGSEAGRVGWLFGRWGEVKK